MIRITAKVRANETSIHATLLAARGAYVSVGIPRDKSLRFGDKVTNAQLLYIHTFGSPLQKLPARPVIQPAIEQPEVRQEIHEALAGGLKAILAKNAGSARWWLQKAGRIGRDAAQAWFFNTNNQWPPLAASTVARKGNDQPLIETQRMYDAISYRVTLKETTTGENKKTTEKESPKQKPPAGAAAMLPEGGLAIVEGGVETGTGEITEIGGLELP